MPRYRGTRSQAKTYRCESFLTYKQTQCTKFTKYSSRKCLSAAAGLFQSSVYMLCMVWLMLANLTCHAALSDGKHMSTEERKPIHTAALTWSWYSNASHVFLVYLSTFVNSELLVSLTSQKQYLPSNNVSKQTNRNKPAFHFRVDLVPEICKVLNQ